MAILMRPWQRAAIASRTIRLTYRPIYSRLAYSTSAANHEDGTAAKHQEDRPKDVQDPRLREIEHVIEDEYAFIKDVYQTPKNPIVLAHGLFGFEELHVAGPMLPGLKYWRGITEAFQSRGVEFIIGTVPPSGSIEARAQRLSEVIEEKAKGKSVNIIAHSMRSPERLDLSKRMLIRIPGSAFADQMFKWIGPTNIPKLYKLLEFFGLDSGAFSQLTQDYMQHNFNPKTPDREGVRYFSYGATAEPHFFSMFRQSHRIIQALEGPNDGLVSVSSSKWGTYKGTLKDVSHLDMINWTSRLRWYFWKLTGHKRNFNAIALYLDIADMLAKEGL
ncbi:hypothetical protein MBLNU457_g0192t2 [Dothideomycetes sp. NU457]